MAKKILSILCALAMMVTMVSVAAFSASAAEPVAMGNITSTNWEKWASVNTGSHGQSGYYNTTTAGDAIWVMAQNTNVKITSTIGTYNISDAYTLAFDLFYKSGTNTIFNVTIGDLVVTFTTSTDDLAGSATYNGTAVSFNDTILLDWHSYSSVTPQTMADELAAAISDAGLSENWIAKNKNYNPNKKTNVQIKLEDGTLTIVSGSLTYTANLTAAGYDKTADLGETEVKLAVEINKESTATVVGGIGNFTGTYAAATTGGEGGETPDPEVPTSGTFVGLENATVAHESLADWSKSGEFNSAVFGETILVAGKKATATFADSYNIGDEFEFTYKMTSVYNQTAGDGVVIKLGKLAISVAGTKNAPHYQVSIAYNGKTVATSAESGYPYSTGVHQEDQVADDANYGSTFLDEIHSNVSTALYKDINKVGGQSFFVHTVTCTYKDGKVSVTLFSGSTTTVEAQIDNADFTNAAMSIEVMSSGNWYHKAIHNLAGTYTPYVAPAVDPLAPGKFLSINDSLAINFAYAEGALADYTDVEVNASIGGKGETLTPVKKTLTDGVYDVYVVDFLTPDLFGTDVEFSITAKKGGADVSYETTYSVKDYCVNMMNGDNAKLNNLCAYILKYGEAVRVMNGGAGDSITAGVDFSGIDSSLVWTAEGKTSKYGVSSTDGAVSWNSGNLNLADNVGINFTFTLPAGASADDYNLFVDVVGAEYGVVGGDVESITPLGNNKYKAVARIYAYDMDKDVTAVVKDTNNNAVSAVFTSGVENYILEAIAQDKFDANELAVAEALLTYGNAAAAYKAN